MNRLSLASLSLLIALGGCHVGGQDRTADNMSLNADDTGQVSFNLPFAKGNVKLPQGTFHNGQFDIDGVKMIEGGTIHGFNMDVGARGARVHVAFNAPKSPEEVRTYFLDQFRQNGDQAAQSGNSILGKTKDGEAFVIQIGPAAQGSEGTISIQSKS